MVSLRDAIDLLIQHAEKLRAAGVESISLDGFACTLAKFVEPADGAATASPKSPGGASQGDPLSDEDTFGGQVPGYVLDDKDVE